MTDSTEQMRTRWVIKCLLSTHKAPLSLNTDTGAVCVVPVLCSPGLGQLWGHHTWAFLFQQLRGLWAGLETEIQLLCPGAFSKKPLSENAGEPLGGGRSLYPQTEGLEHPRIPGRSRRAPSCPCVSCEEDASSRWDLPLLQQGVDNCAWQSCFPGEVNEQLPVEPMKSWEGFAALEPWRSSCFCTWMQLLNETKSFARGLCRECQPWWGCWWSWHCRVQGLGSCPGPLECMEVLPFAFRDLAHTFQV